MFKKIWNWIKSLFGGSSGSSEDPKPVPPVKTAKTLIGVAYPWDFWKMDAVALAKELYKRGCTITEIDADIFTEDVNLLKKYITEFRKYGIKTLLVVVNGNSQEIIKKSISWYEGFIQRIIATIGTDHVILNPVSEPRYGDEAKIKHWIDYALNNWHGETSVTVKFDWAKQFDGRSTYREFHMCEDPTERNMSHSAKDLFVTDCGKTLGMDAGRAAIAVRAAITNNTNFLLYEAHGNHSGQINFATLNAIGKVIQES